MRIIGGLFAFLIIAIISARLYFSDNRLKTLASETLRKSTASEVQIESLKIDNWLQIKIIGLTLLNSEDSTKWFSVDSIRIKISPNELISKKLKIRYILVDGGLLDYGNIPKSLMAAVPDTSQPKTVELPFRVIMDSCVVSSFAVIGPQADMNLELAISKLNFTNIKNFSFAYEAEGKDGKIHYEQDTIGIECNLDIAASGKFSTVDKSRQNFNISISNIEATFGNKYDIGNVDASLNSTTNINDNSVDIDSMRISLNNSRLISGGGMVQINKNPNVMIVLDPVIWKLEQFSGLIRQSGMPLKLDGAISLDKGLINISTESLVYHLGLELSNLAINYSDTAFVAGLNGSILVDGTNGSANGTIASSVESVRYLLAKDKALKIANLTLEGNGGINDNIVTFDLDGKIADFFGGDMVINAVLEKSNVNFNIAANNLDLSNLSNRLMTNGEMSANGKINMTTSLSGHRDSVAFKSDIAGMGMSIVSGNDTLSLGDRKFDLQGNAMIDKDRIRADANYKLDNVFDGNLSANYPLSKSSKDSISARFYLNIDDAQLPAFFPKNLTEILGPMDISGFTKINGNISSPTDSINPSGAISIVIEPTDVLLEDYKILIRQFTGLSEISLHGLEMSIESHDTVGALYAENYSDIAFENIPISARLDYGSDSIWKLGNLTALIPSLRTSIVCAGEFGSVKDIPFSNIKYSIKRDSPDTSALNSMISIYGALNCDFETDQLGDTLKFGGQFNLDSLGIVGPAGISCSGITGNAPITGTMNMYDSLFVKKPVGSMFPISTYRRDRQGMISEGKFGNITIGSVRAPDINVDNISVDLSFRDGVLMMPLITGNILGGNFVGKSSFDISEINMMREFPNFDRLGYEMSLELASLDFNQLVGSFGPQESSALFSADFSFRGRGLIAPGADYTLDGVFNITEMGPQVANRVLDVIDPQNQNPGVAQTRALLNRKFLKIIDLSYRPKSFSFKIEHGAAYPEIYMDQPFFAEAIPILRIPMPIRYGRIPIKTIIDNLKEAGWQ